MAELDVISEKIYNENKSNPIMDFLKNVFSVTPKAAPKKELAMKMTSEKAMPFLLKDNRKMPEPDENTHERINEKNII